MQGLIEVRPGASGLDGDGHIDFIDLENPVHPGQIEQHGVRLARGIAARIAHPPTARNDGNILFGGSRDSRRQFLLVLRPDNRQQVRTTLIDVMRVEIENGALGQHGYTGFCNMVRCGHVCFRRHQIAFLTNFSLVAASASGRLSGYRPSSIRSAPPMKKA